MVLGEVCYGLAPRSDLNLLADRIAPCAPSHRARKLELPRRLPISSRPPRCVQCRCRNDMPRPPGGVCRHLEHRRGLHWHTRGNRRYAFSGRPAPGAIRPHTLVRSDHAPSRIRLATNVRRYHDRRVTRDSVRLGQEESVLIYRYALGYRASPTSGTKPNVPKSSRENVSPSRVSRIICCRESCPTGINNRPPSVSCS